MTVIGIIKRKGSVALKYINKSNIKNIKPILDRNIDFYNTNLYTDESSLYRGYEREVINHSKGEYTRGKASTNSIENVFGLFKRRVYSIHHQITKAYW